MQIFYEGDYCFWNGKIYEIPREFYKQIMEHKLSQSEIAIIISK